VVVVVVLVWSSSSSCCCCRSSSSGCSSKALFIYSIIQSFSIRSFIYSLTDLRTTV